jgi:hypothetical protein
MLRAVLLSCCSLKSSVNSRGLACHADQAQSKPKGYLSVSNGRTNRNTGIWLALLGTGIIILSIVVGSFVYPYSVNPKYALDCLFGYFFGSGLWIAGLAIALWKDG